MDLVVVSNRGPLSFNVRDDGTLASRPGAGGLVSSLAPMVAECGATWIAAAMSDGDRRAAAAGRVEVGGARFHILTPDPEVYRLAYEEMSNATLWFLHHRIFDLSRHPVIDARWWEAWDAYRQVNRVFADAVAELAPEHATVLVQDYHLTLLAPALAERRPDLRAVHFTHTPFAEAADLRVLPDAVARELLTGMGAHRACGFHTRRWAAGFADGTRHVLGTRARTFVSPMAPDVDALRKVAASEACSAATARLDDLVGDRAVILRVDRVEPSKNLLRGFEAYDALLTADPGMAERVVFVAMVYATREGVVGYATYRREVEELVDRINRRWGRPGWTPIILDVEDDIDRSVAALQRYDVLLVNPVRDGLNLVAKEGPLVNARDGVLVLSREAGAWDELGDTAIGINPFDVGATADALARALAMGTDERRAHAEGVRAAAARRTPRDWLDDQLRAGRRARPGPAG